MAAAEPDPDWAARLGLRRVHRGKVRDLYETPDGLLLLVASDRISAFDVVLPTPIPDKGVVLTALSRWWLDRLTDVVPHHLAARELPMPYAGEPALRGRAVLCRRLDMVPVECVARGYLAGSGLAEYHRGGSVCGVPLPPGLEDGSRLPQPIFTPATKAAAGGHDENIALDAVVSLVGRETADRLRDVTLAVYRRGAEVAERRGILLADTKIELGHDPATGELLLADEVLTPDSSRFWPADRWRPGAPQPSYDKQYVRDWLRSPAAGWDRAAGAPPPALPDHVVAATRARYVEAFERLTGTAFAPG